MIVLKSSRLRTSTDISFTFGSAVISQSDFLKVLGITIDPHLNWEKHISTIIQRCFAILKGLARLRHKLPRETKRLLIQAIVFPHLQYCMSVWGSCTATQRRRVQKVLNFGARLVAGLGRRDSVSAVLQELGWLSVEEQIRLRDTANIGRILAPNNPLPHLREHVISRSAVSARASRATAGGQLELPRVRTEFARRSFAFRAVQCWNQQPMKNRKVTEVTRSV